MMRWLQEQGLQATASRTEFGDERLEEESAAEPTA